MFKVGDKVRIKDKEQTYGDFYSGRVGIVTDPSDSLTMVTSLEGLPPHYVSGVGFDEKTNDFHLCFNSSDLEPVKETKMQVPFTITSNMISVFLDGKSHFVSSTDGAYADLKEHLKGEHDPEVIRDLVDKKAFVTKVTEGMVTVADQEVLYKGEPVHSALTQKLLTLVAEGFDVRPWARFMDNLMQNPSYKSREALFQFLDKWMAPITEDGHFVALKNVRGDFLDIHSGTMDNSPGKLVSMPRDQVDDDHNRTCSSGLHACATPYLDHFYVNGGKTVAVKINPRDVVSVPADYSHAKMRVCQYEVLREVTREEANRFDTVPTYDALDEYEQYNDEYDGYYSSYEEDYDSYGDTY